jgi:two-component system, OmpR family, sensor kinase
VKFWVQSIRARLTFWYTLLVLSTLLAFGAFAYYYTSKNLSENLDLSLRREVGWVRDYIQPRASKVKPTKRSVESLLRQRPKQQAAVPDTVEGEAAEEADEIWNQIYQHTLYSPKKTFIQVSDRKGTLFYRSINLGEDTLHLDATLARDTSFLEYAWLTDQSIRVAVLRERNFTFLVGYPVAELREALENLFSIFLVLIPIALAVSVIGGLYLANKSLRPVDEVTTRARRITAENLDQTIPQRDVDDEIGRLISTFNEMIHRLHSSFAQVRQFSADASHELRTPLTVMRGEIELALRNPKTLEEYRQVLESSMEEIIRMSSIIENLLTLAKADQGTYEVNLSEVNLGSLVEELYDDGEILAEGKHIRVTLAAKGPITIVGDKVRLRQLFLNLIDNAIKYTPEGGAVTLSVERRNGAAVVQVADTGIGIPPEDINRIFDRFYRVDKARSREIGGTGLGLSIAKWIVELHRGTITVKSEVDKGSVFTVELPIN